MTAPLGRCEWSHMRPVTYGQGLLAVTLCACALPEQNAANERAQARLSAATTDAMGALWFEKCEASDQKRCGLVTTETGSYAFRAKFVERVCAGVNDAACGDRFVKMLAARMRERYFAAPVDAQTDWCDAYPVECADPRAFELHLLTLHNESVAKKYSAAARAIRDDRQQESEQARQRAVDAWRRFGAAMQQTAPTTVNCTTTAVGSTAYTHFQ